MGAQECTACAAGFFSERAGFIPTISDIPEPDADPEIDSNATDSDLAALSDDGNSKTSPTKCSDVRDGETDTGAHPGIKASSDSNAAHCTERHPSLSLASSQSEALSAEAFLELGLDLDGCMHGLREYEVGVEGVEGVENESVRGKKTAREEEEQAENECTDEGGPAVDHEHSDESKEAKMENEGDGVRAAAEQEKSDEPSRTRLVLLKLRGLYEPQLTLGRASLRSSRAPSRPSRRYMASTSTFATSAATAAAPNQDTPCFHSPRASRLLMDSTSASPSVIPLGLSPSALSDRMIANLFALDGTSVEELAVAFGNGGSGSLLGCGCSEEEEEEYVDEDEDEDDVEDNDDKGKEEEEKEAWEGGGKMPRDARKEDEDGSDKGSRPRPEDVDAPPEKMSSALHHHDFSGGPPPSHLAYGYKSSPATTYAFAAPLGPHAGSGKGRKIGTGKGGGTNESAAVPRPSKSREQLSMLQPRPFSAGPSRPSSMAVSCRLFSGSGFFSALLSADGHRGFPFVHSYMPHTMATTDDDDEVDQQVEAMEVDAEEADDKEGEKEDELVHMEAAQTWAAPMVQQAAATLAAARAESKDARRQAQQAAAARSRARLVQQLSNVIDKRRPPVLLPETRDDALGCWDVAGASLARTLTEETQRAPELAPSKLVRMDGFDPTHPMASPCDEVISPFATPCYTTGAPSASGAAPAPDATECTPRPLELSPCLLMDADRTDAEASSDAVRQGESEDVACDAAVQDWPSTIRCCQLNDHEGGFFGCPLPAWHHGPHVLVGERSSRSTRCKPPPPPTSLSGSVPGCASAAASVKAKRQRLPSPQAPLRAQRQRMVTRSALKPTLAP